MEANQQQSDMEIVEAVGQEAKCPRCLGHLYRPDKQCLTGHVICRRCSNTLVYCPVCQKLLIEFSPEIFNSLYNLFKYPCVFENRGCTYKGNDYELIKHQELCTFWRGKCFMKFCEQILEYSNRFEHMSTEHDAYLFLDDSPVSRVFRVDQLMDVTLPIGRRICILKYDGYYYMMYVLKKYEYFGWNFYPIHSSMYCKGLFIRITINSRSKEIELEHDCDGFFVYSVRTPLMDVRTEFELGDSKEFDEFTVHFERKSVQEERDQDREGDEPHNE